MIPYGGISKWGRLRALPVADEASNKEWQRSKFCVANSKQKISGTATGHNEAEPTKIKLQILSFLNLSIYTEGYRSGHNG